MSVEDQSATNGRPDDEHGNGERVASGLWEVLEDYLDEKREDGAADATIRSHRSRVGMFIDWMETENRYYSLDELTPYDKTTVAENRTGYYYLTIQNALSDAHNLDAKSVRWSTGDKETGRFIVEVLE